MKRILFPIVSLFVVLVFTGCAGLISSNYKAADDLYDKHKLDKGTSLVIATVVNINNLEKSTTLGRTISEHVSSKFTDLGMNIVEMKLRDNIYIKSRTGELVLSREINKLAKDIKADVIIAGTYSNAFNSVYVNLKIIDLKSNVILSTIDYELSKDDNIRGLLNEEITKW